jgi:Fic family protein
MLGTFAIVSDRREMSIVSNTPDELIELLQTRHKKLLSARQEKHPGLFKMQNNRAGNSLFVDYELVKGTLKKGFDFYRALRSPFAKAVFMLFMVSEIHPFDDGNGRVSRIMMNAELTHANETKIIIPTVFRTDYLDALRKFTRQSDPTALIRAMSRVHRFSAQLQTENFETLQLQLERANAFSDSEDKILRF